MKSRYIYIKSLACFLCLAILLSFVPHAMSAAPAGTRVDLARCSERFLSDFAVSEGGTVYSDDNGNIVFDISDAGHNLKFKCTGEFSSGEQNAICLWLNNLTGSTKIYVEIVFMNFNGVQETMHYEKTVENSGSDVYLFVPSPENEIVVSISLKAAGVSEGTISVMGIWHCYYSFPTDGNDIGIGSLNTLCYENGGSSVLIEGSVLHDITIASRDSTINVYRLLPGETLDEEFVRTHVPVAGCSMSRSFSFTVSNRTGGDYASAYAVTINKPDGSIDFIIEDKRYPDAEYTPRDSNDFKGVATGLEYIPFEMTVSSLVIDIETDDLISELGGYLYSFGGKNYLFDSTVIDTIHRRITSHTADSGSVYLRLLLSENGSPYEYMPYNADGEAAADLYAAISFLCERYSESIDGIIIGNKFDTPYNYKNTVSVSYSDYIRMYSDYVSVVLSAARNVNPSMKVVIPVSSNTEYYSDEEYGSDKYPMFAMLISFFEVYSTQNSGEVTMMVYDSTFPYVDELLASGGSPLENSRDTTTLPTKKEIMNLTVENTYMFESFLDYLGKRFGVADDKYFFMWQPYGFREADELKLAYIYSYFNLCSSERIYSFFCDFTEDEYRGDFSKSEDMLDAVAAMGGSNAKEFADECLKKYSAGSFSSIAGYVDYVPSVAGSYSFSVGTKMPQGIVGKAPMSDFASPACLTSWKKGVYTEAISIDSVNSGNRALRAAMNLPAYESEFAELIYTFDKAVNLIGVDSIALSLIIDSYETLPGADYTVKVVVGGYNSKGVAQYTVDAESGENFNIYIDTADFSGMSEITYLKICVQNNSGLENNLVMHICGIDIMSKTLSDAELSELVAIDSDEDNLSIDLGVTNNSIIAPALFIFFAVSVISIVAVIAVMRNRKKN